MSRSLHFRFYSMGLLFGLAATLFSLLFTTAGDPNTSGGGLPDKELCRRNLLLIHDAIQAYRIAHKDLPDTLSELFPAHLSDRKILFCPAARKRALTSAALTGRHDVTDPGTSYFYEFSPAPSAEVPGRTQRDWKRAQMGILGSVVPIARCLLHDRPLNLSFGGEIYESQKLEWEFKFTNLVEYARLQENYLLTPVHPLRVVQIPPRDAAAAPEQVDLSELYNGSLAKPWLNGKPTLSFASLPIGLHDLLGIRFDLRGLVQLSSPALGRLGEDFPERVTIPLRRSCHQLHFLVGTSFAEKSPAAAGRFDIRFADGEIVEFPFRIPGDSQIHSDEDPSQPVTATLAWRAQRPSLAELFKVAWTNARPVVEIRAIDCVGTGNEIDFFLVALAITP